MPAHASMHRECRGCWQEQYALRSPGIWKASLEPGPFCARHFPGDVLLLATTARERAWRLPRIHSQFFDYVFLGLSRAFTIIWTLMSPFIRSHKPTETFIFAQAWLCWSSNFRRYRAISDQLLSGDHAARKRLVLTFPKTPIVTKFSLSVHRSKGPPQLLPLNTNLRRS